MSTFLLDVTMNRLSLQDRARILGCLVEGNSLRATTRMIGVSVNTVTETERSTFNTSHAGMQQGWTGTMEQITAYLAKLQAKN